MGPSYQPVEPDTPLAGRAVVGARHDHVGTVTDVFFDDRGAPQWATVRTGALSGEHFMPLRESYLDEHGRLVVPLDKITVKRAPRVRRDHMLTLATRRGLRDYYGEAA
jgi:hypothetical protein